VATLQLSVAALRVFGDDVIPSEISRLLGAEPSKASIKGEPLQGKPSGRSRTARTGSWRLQVPDREPGDPNAQVAQLLGQLTTDLQVWRDIAERFQVDLFCGWFMGESNEGISLSPETLRALGERGIELQLDIYGPESEASIGQLANDD
jgi:Domain of unknown function (DUF4279)